MKFKNILLYAALLSGMSFSSSILVNDGKLRTTGFEMQAIYHGKAGGLKYDFNTLL
jgi:hypothetical protein